MFLIASLMGVLLAGATAFLGLHPAEEEDESDQPDAEADRLTDAAGGGSMIDEFLDDGPLAGDFLAGDVLAGVDHGDPALHDDLRPVTDGAAPDDAVGLTDDAPPYAEADAGAPLDMSPPSLDTEASSLDAPQPDDMADDSADDFADGGTLPVDGIQWGGPGDDVLQGGAGPDQIGGYDGADSLAGADGEDWLLGGTGDDSLAGGAGADLIEGNEGHDSLFGGAGNDTLLGGMNRDLLHGGEGNDSAEGGAGADWLEGRRGDDALLGGLGNDTLMGGDGADTLFGGWGADVLSGVVARLNADGVWHDTDTADYLNGGGGADTIVAGNGDIVTGGQGFDDILVGDWMAGGEAARVLDFEPGTDQLLVVHDGPGPAEVSLVEVAGEGLQQVLLNGSVVAVLSGLAPATLADVVVLTQAEADSLLAEA